MTVDNALNRPMAAADLMTTPPVWVAPDASVWAAWDLMSRTGLRHLLVVQKGRCVGVIDDRSVFAEWPMGPLAIRRRRVKEMMRGRTTCVVPEADVRSAALVMVREGVDAVPVVGDDGEMVGIVTVGDLTAAVARHGVSVPLEEPVPVG